MFDDKPILVRNLSTILPTYYELFVDSTTQTPCITYQEINNYSVAESETLRYSQIEYYIKLWGKNLAELTPYLPQIDNSMKGQGFRRTGYNELALGNNQLCLILRYTGLAKE